MFNVLLFGFIAMIIGALLSQILSFIKIRIVVAALFSLIAFAFVATESKSLFHTILSLIMILSVILKIIQDIVVFKIRSIKYVKFVSFVYYFAIYTISIVYMYFVLFRNDGINYINHSITLRILSVFFVMASAYGAVDLMIFMKKVSKVIKSLTYSNFEGLCEKLEIDYEDDRHKSDEEIKEDDEMAGKRAMLRLTLERLAQRNEIKILYLSNTDVYFNPAFFNRCRELAENISKSDIRVDKNLAILNIKSTLALPDNLLTDFFVVENDSIELHEFDDGDFFVHNINIDKIVTCASCGKAKLASMMEEIEGEWFCSDMCEETEDLCYKISYEKDFGEKPIGETISDYGSVGATTLGAGQAYSYDFIPLSNKDTGHGFMAERFNTIVDKFSGKEASIVGNDNIKGGPDRFVNGRYIQTKYYSTAVRSVNSNFDQDGNYTYTKNNQDIEIPKDQAIAGREYLFDQLYKGLKKIPNKDLAGNKDKINEFLDEYFRPGSATYEQAKNVSKFFTKESLQYDAALGSLTALSAGGISFAINTAITYWKTKDIKLAIKSSVVIGGKKSCMSFATFMTASQLNKIDQVHNFLNKAININLGGNISSSLGILADTKSNILNLETIGSKSKMSNINKANSTLQGATVAAAATIAVTSSIEIIKMARGRISSMQCIKNIVVSASGITGGTIGGIIGGALLAPIPIVGPLVGSFVGGAVGGMVASKVAKTVMDEFIVDDSIKMMEIVTRHLEYLAKNFLLSDDEMKLLTNEVDMLITQNGKFLEEVFAAASRRAFVNSKLKPIVVRITKNTRAKVPFEALEENNIIDVIAEEFPA
ncbi:hypothetical protein [Brachyspira sp. G79]|uniref:hypothetical protein n=1 Tax=Brachyspira sp. G79 TaxID=1358104 RepID=UPI000BBCC20D|nr:hypothetical protein [Brachyspira sp. G79]PCG19806.1 hypothetical protein KQ44_07005 [Brachyspira sp. G79]